MIAEMGKDEGAGTADAARRTEDRRRLIRLKRSGMLTSPLEMSVHYGLALSRESLERSFRLVYDAYEEVGLQAPNDARLRFTPHHAWPGTKVFIADYCPDFTRFLDAPAGPLPVGEIIGTVTLAVDGPLGLPMEEVCGPDVRALRARGERMAEVIALSVHPDYRQSNIILRLYKVMVEYALFAGITQLGCAVLKPHHAFYRDVLLFHPVGDIQPYSKGNGLEAQGHMLDLRRAPARFREVYGGGDFDTDLHSFFTRVLGQFKSLLSTPWSESTQNYFLKERTRAAESWDASTREALRAEYARLGGRFIH